VNINRWFMTSAAYPISLRRKKTGPLWPMGWWSVVYCCRCSATAEEDCPVRQHVFKTPASVPEIYKKCVRNENIFVQLNINILLVFTLELWQQWQHRHCALDYACSYACHCLTLSWGGWCLILAPESHGHAYVFTFILETLTSVKTHIGNNMYC
jgi:hypothetical protein